MATLELKALTKEIIHKMGMNTHDLWLVKIEDEISGPFDVTELKEYAAKNEFLFDDALASRLDTNDFQPFWSHALFQRRGPQIVKSSSEKGPFWLHLNGQVVGPFSAAEINKKIDSSEITMIDHISTNEGDSWKKVYEIASFDRRTKSAENLPQAPLEANFQKAKLILLEKLEAKEISNQEEIANLACSAQACGKVINFKIDELTLYPPKETNVSNAVKWVVPCAMALVITVALFGQSFFASDEQTLAIKRESAPKRSVAQAQPNPSRNIPRKQPTIPTPQMPSRVPASVRPYQAPPAPTHPAQEESRYPTHVETHTEEYTDPPEHDMRDPYDGHQAENERPHEEHSLISSGPPQTDDQSLDAAMNGIVIPPDEPIMEEISDF